MDALVEVAPIGLDGLENEPSFLAVLKGLGEHGRRAVDTDDIETGLHQTDGMKASARGGIENALLAKGAQDVDEELPLGLRPSIPIDQFIPLVRETHYELSA